MVTTSGFVKARHLDDKAGVAAALAAFKAVRDAGVTVPVTAHLLVTSAEEVGQGATHGLDPLVAEIVSIDAAVVAPGQQSREDAVSVAMADGVGAVRLPPHPQADPAGRRVRGPVPPRRLRLLPLRPRHRARGRRRHPHRAARLRRRRHPRPRADPRQGLQHLAQLVALYLQTDLVFPEWDVEPEGELAGFPSLAVQPASEEGPREGPIGIEDGD